MPAWLSYLIAQIIAAMTKPLGELFISQAEKPTQVYVDNATEEEKEEARSFDAVDIGLFLAAILIAFGCISCFKPREYVLSREKVYILARDTVVPVVVHDRDNSQTVIVKHQFRAGDKIKMAE